MDTLLPCQENQVLITLLLKGISTLYLVHTFLEAMDTLLPWQKKQVLITLLFEGIRTSYLVYTFLEATAISGIACCYGCLVTIATEAGAYNIAFQRYKNFIFGARIP